MEGARGCAVGPLPCFRRSPSLCHPLLLLLRCNAPQIANAAPRKSFKSSEEDRMKGTDFALFRAKQKKGEADKASAACGAPALSLPTPLARARTTP